MALVFWNNKIKNSKSRNWATNLPNDSLAAISQPTNLYRKHENKLTFEVTLELILVAGSVLLNTTFPSSSKTSSRLLSIHINLQSSTHSSIRFRSSDSLSLVVFTFRNMVSTVRFRKPTFSKSTASLSQRNSYSATIALICLFFFEKSIFNSNTARGIANQPDYRIHHQIESVKHEWPSMWLHLLAENCFQCSPCWTVLCSDRANLITHTQAERAVVCCFLSWDVENVNGWSIVKPKSILMLNEIYAKVYWNRLKWNKLL